MLSFGIGSILLIKDEDLRTVYSDLSFPFYDLIATAALIFASKQSSKISKRLAWGWGMLAIAQFFITLGDILWAIFEVYLKITPFPSIADVFYLSFYPFFLAGILLLLVRRFQRSEWIKRTLDIGIIMIAAILGFWIFLIQPLIGLGPTASSLQNFLTVAYPVGDLILLFALLVLMYYRSEKFIHGSLLILSIYALVTIVTDSIFSYQSLTGTYISGGVLDLSFLLTYMLFAFAGVYQAVASQTFKESDTLPQKNLITEERISQVLDYLPYIGVLGAGLLLIKYHDLESVINSNTLITAVGCIVGLVIIRQIVTLVENKRLLSNLGNALEKGNRQASDMDKLNLDLQQEIIRRKIVEKQLSYDALHDGLTGLANRVLLMDRLAHAVEMIKRKMEFNYSILFADIDDFKSINDEMGHSSGDLALIEVAQILKKCTRSVDTVARFAGDEFVILLECTEEKKAALAVAKRIGNELKHPVIIKGKKITISCSVGIVQGISEYNLPEEILMDADIALYRAKELGKARYEIYNTALRSSAMSRLEMESDLYRAISKNELFLDYQPIYSLEQKHIEGVEALVRWHHPGRGVIMPSEFIHMAEQSEVIIQIGDWVLREACTQLKKWQSEFPGMDHLSIYVNISAKQIAQKDFFVKVKETLHESGLDPKRLILEITEHAFIENQILMGKLLTDLKKIGVAFAIDDFGTGFSSLGYLQNFTVDTIKIDKFFIDEVADSKKGSEIVKTIILMAQGMGMNTIAEGIENVERLQKLISLACKYGQGFYLSKPVDGKRMKTILRNQTVLKSNLIVAAPSINPLH